jgi:hypothetical protein
MPCLAFRLGWRASRSSGLRFVSSNSRVVWRQRSRPDPALRRFPLDRLRRWWRMRLMHPFLAPDFHVRWSTLVPEAVEPDIRHALEDRQASIEAICAQDPAAATYESTFLALRKRHRALNHGWGRLNHLDSVCDNPAQREALNRMLPEVTDFYSSIPLNERLWAVLKAVGESPGNRQRSTPVRKARFVEETMADFRQSGADLPPDAEDSASPPSRPSFPSSPNNTPSTCSTRPTPGTWSSPTKRGSPACRSPPRPPPPRTPAPRASPPTGSRRGASPCSSPRCSADAAPPRRRHPPPGLGGLRKVGAYGEHDNTALVWRILELRHEKSAILGHEPLRRSHAAAPHGPQRRNRAEIHRKPPLRILRPFTRTPPARPIQGGQDRPARRPAGTMGSRLLGRNASARKTTISMTRRCARISRSMA